MTGSKPEAATNPRLRDSPPMVCKLEGDAPPSPLSLAYGIGYARVVRADGPLFTQDMQRSNNQLLQ